MPLIIAGGSISEVLSVECMCGNKSRDYGEHYAHVGKCELTRCSSCLTVLCAPPLTDERFDTPEAHLCPYTIIGELRRGVHAADT